MLDDKYEEHRSKLVNFLDYFANKLENNLRRMKTAKSVLNSLEHHPPSAGCSLSGRTTGKVICGEMNPQDARERSHRTRKNRMDRSNFLCIEEGRFSLFLRRQLETKHRDNPWLVFASQNRWIYGLIGWCSHSLDHRTQIRIIGYWKRSTALQEDHLYHPLRIVSIFSIAS